MRRFLDFFTYLCDKFFNMGSKEDKEKAKFVRETVTKYFFDMSKSTYTIMVLGGLAAVFGIIKSDQEETLSAILIGVCLTVVLAIIGLLISKKIKYNEYFRNDICNLSHTCHSFFVVATHAVGEKMA